MDVRLLILSVCCFAPGAAFAHGDLHPRIQEATKQIAAAPTNAALYFDRGDLYRLHRDWTNALADFDKAVKLDPKLSSKVDLALGRLWLDADEPARALAPLDRYLAGVTNNADAWVARARARARTDRLRPAADDYTRAIALRPGGEPELYIERAEALAKIGANEDAVRGLDEGISRMGPLVTLQLEAIEIETATKRFDSALKRIDTVMARLQRKESWLVRRAQTLNLAGRTAESRAAYEQALAAIEKLPPAHRNTRATIQLEASIRSALKQ
jgi:tetratricopeptide (TPR) repeat protein